MRVRRGTIYALLGPSGCGKTTLLSCILGRKSLESGHIAVFGGCPGDRSLGLPGGLVSFMPQDICLYSQFTIRETFWSCCNQDWEVVKMFLLTVAIKDHISITFTLPVESSERSEIAE